MPMLKGKRKNAKKGVKTAKISIYMAKYLMPHVISGTQTEI
jgi:hypothetical protein